MLNIAEMTPLLYIHHVAQDILAHGNEMMLAHETWSRYTHPMLCCCTVHLHRRRCPHEHRPEELQLQWRVSLTLNDENMKTKRETSGTKGRELKSPAMILQSREGSRHHGMRSILDNHGPSTISAVDAYRQDSNNA